MEQLVYTVIVSISSVIASSGFWMFVMKKTDKQEASDKMLRGLAHDRIMTLGLEYIRRGEITKDEYENLYEYLYVPYLGMDGNGSAKRVMDEVSRLPLKHTTILKEVIRNNE